MNRIFGISVALATTLAFGAAQAQLVPPAPPKSPAMPEYTPPPPPPAVPTPARSPDSAPNVRPAEPEKPLASLIEKDEKGRIKPLKYPLDEAAVRALELSPEAKDKVEKSLLARRVEVDRIVVENLPALLDIRKAMMDATETTSMDVMTETSKKSTPFRANKLLDRLVKDGAITPNQKTQATNIAREYKTAMRDEATKDAGGHSNMQAMVLVGFKLTMQDFCAESFQELDRMLAESAPKAEELLKGLGLPAGHAALKSLPKLKGTGAAAGKTAADSVKSIFYETLDADQQKAYLLAANPELKAADAPKTNDAAK